MITLLPMEIEILQDWSEVLAVNKPAGWLSIPGRGENQNVPILSERLGDQLRGGQKRDPKKNDNDLYIIHRLDKGTSGVILFARNKEAHRKLSLLFETREVEKIYWCLVKGLPAPQTIDAPIFRLPSKKIRSIVDPKGKPSSTQIKPLASFDGVTLVEAKPLTGRTHQIRVHLSHIGFPLLGDPLYGGSTEIFKTSLPYPLLHSRSISYKWNESSQRMAIAPIGGQFLETAKNVGFAASC
jgi:RluA family pseudouridine synthase